MQYLTGVHALNTSCSLNTCGDWHTSSLYWNRPMMAESEGSFFGDYGIEKNRKIPEYAGMVNVANHIRACLDLLYLGKYALVQDMRDGFIVTDEYDSEIFEKVCSMRVLQNWDQINQFMHREYKMAWINYLEKENEKHRK